MPCHHPHLRQYQIAIQTLLVPGPRQTLVGMFSWPEMAGSEEQGKARQRQSKDPSPVDKVKKLAKKASAALGDPESEPDALKSSEKMTSVCGKEKSK